MLEYFSKISSELGKRCETLICDVRSGSSSFFTSYRSLVECFVKAVVDGSPYREKYNEKTLTFMLCSDEITEYCVSRWGLDLAAHKKVKNYILKINRQVHEREKELDDELVKSYLHALYDYTAPYARSKGFTVLPLTDEDILDAFMSYSEEILKSDEKLRTFETDLSTLAEYIKVELEERQAENEEQQAELLEQIKDSSVRYLAYFGTKRDHDACIARCLILCAVLVCAGIISTLVMSFYVDFYYFLDLLANIFLIRMVLFTFRITKTTSVIKLSLAQDIMPMDFLYGIPRTLNKYKVMLGFVIAYSLFNIFIWFFDGTVPKITSIPYTIMLIIFIAASIMLIRTALKMYKSYIAFAYKYLTREGDIYTFFELPALGRYFEAEEYKRDIYGAKTIKFPK